MALVPVRAMLALPARTAVISVGISVVLTLSVAAIVGVHSVARDRANTYLPAVPLNAVLVRVNCPLTRAELGALASAARTASPVTFQTATVNTASGSTPVLVKTDLLACLEATGRLAPSASTDWSHCSRQADETYPFRSLGVTDVLNLERLLDRPLTGDERHAYDGGAVLTLWPHRCPCGQASCAMTT
jgi:hypothetical protein